MVKGSGHSIVHMDKPLYTAPKRLGFWDLIRLEFALFIAKLKGYPLFVLAYFDLFLFEELARSIVFFPYRLSGHVVFFGQLIPRKPLLAIFYNLQFPIGQRSLDRVAEFPVNLDCRHEKTFKILSTTTQVQFEDCIEKRFLVGRVKKECVTQDASKVGFFFMSVIPRTIQKESEAGV
jgi:hypothetical protein